METLRSIDPFIGVAVIGAIFAIFLAVSCVKALPDTAVIITGIWKKPRILIGRVGTKIPFLERADTLCLKTIPITIYAQCLTADFIETKTKTVINVQISEEEDMLRLASKNFLNYSSKEIRDSLYKTLQGVINETIRSQTLLNTCKGWVSLEQGICNSATVSTSNLGIKILSCHLLKISTSDGIIKNMATISTSEIKKDALTAEKNLQLMQAQATIEKTITDVNVLLNTNDALQAAIKMLKDMKNMVTSSSPSETANEDSDGNDTLEKKSDVNINHIRESNNNYFAND